MDAANHADEGTEPAAVQERAVGQIDNQGSNTHGGRGNLSKVRHRSGLQVTVDDQAQGARAVASQFDLCNRNRVTSRHTFENPSYSHALEEAKVTSREPDDLRPCPSGGIRRTLGT